MGANPLDHNQSILVTHLHYEPVRIAFDIEDHPVVSKKIGAPIAILDVLGRLPVRRGDFSLPGVQCTSRARGRTLNFSTSGKPKMRILSQCSRIGISA